MCFFIFFIGIVSVQKERLDFVNEDMFVVSHTSK